jgi:hypothetical protein
LRIMKRREFSLIILLMAGIALWLTRDWWLPELAALLPLLKDNAKLLAALDGVLGIGVLVFNVGVGFLVWLSRRDTRVKEGPETELLRRLERLELKFRLIGQVR